MTIEFPSYAKDIKLNISSVLKKDPESSLTEAQIFGIALASSYATKSQNTVNYILDKAGDIISETEKEAARGAASLMAMNNIYYRFVHLASNKEYAKMPAKLRMNLMANPGIEKIDFELYSLAVSSINGCGMCIDAHINQLEKAGLSQGTIQHSIRIAAVVNAAAQTEFIER